MSEKIPKIFHQIWLNGEMPEEYKKLTKILLSLHPDWEYKLWNSDNRPKLFNEDLYNQMKYWKFKADLIRYEILHQYGGVYLDVDFLFQKNMDCFLDMEFIIVNQKNYNRPPGLNNCIMGFPKNHYVIKYIIFKIQEFMSNFEEKSKKLGEHSALLRFIGPGILYSIYDIEPSFKPIDHNIFCPISSREINTVNINDYSNSYAIHLWNSVYGTDIARKINDT